MQNKTKKWLFYAILLTQLELDLLFFSYGLQSLVASLFYLLIYPKKIPLIPVLINLLLILINQFIWQDLSLGLNFSLLLICAIFGKILKNNLTLKTFSYLLILTIYYSASYYLANLYLFKICFNINHLIPLLILNLSYSLLIVKTYGIIKRIR